MLDQSKQLPFGVDAKGREGLVGKMRALNPSTATLAEFIQAAKDAGMMEE